MMEEKETDGGEEEKFGDPIKGWGGKGASWREEG